ncbi:uncharacterized protein LOC116135825 [Pistacia vera]|uniref:uncharacterized protein LOC116135825 n=1 Tax=Pistacia vera TaxID=55513 RepID=UPI0012639015|nr:uncharacterized protein LOC116135825 [Pistacia vera]
MEEERAKYLYQMKRPRKLDFNAPLLSIRRPSGCTDNSQPKLQDTGHSIPFCWEEVPGMPKDSQKSPERDTPRLRLPPGRLHPHKQVPSNEDLHDLHQDDSCDGDIDVDDDYADVFSNPMDVLSLTEAIDIVEKAEQNHGLDGFNLEHNDSISPSYIMERFLPDATALAASSVINGNLSNKLPYVCNDPETRVSEAVGRSYSLPKVCGLEMLLPWRMKHRICGIKSPVRQACSANVQVKPQSSAKHKRSIVRPFGDHVKKHTGCISYST